MYVLCELEKNYAEILAGQNRVNSVFPGEGRKVTANPQIRRVIEIPAEATVNVGDIYDPETGFSSLPTPLPVPTLEEVAVQNSGKSLQRRKIGKLLESDPVEALLIQGGLK